MDVGEKRRSCELESQKLIIFSLVGSARRYVSGVGMENGIHAEVEKESPFPCSASSDE